MADHLSDQTIGKIILLSQLAGEAKSAMRTIEQLMAYEREHNEYERLRMAYEVITKHHQNLVRQCELIAGINL